MRVMSKWLKGRRWTDIPKLVMKKVLFSLKENACPIYLADTVDNIC